MLKKKNLGQQEQHVSKNLGDPEMTMRKRLDDLDALVN